MSADEKLLSFKTASGLEVWRSDEFRAFARRFRIPLDQKTKTLTITITMDEMFVQLEFFGSVEVKSDTSVIRESGRERVVSYE